MGYFSNGTEGVDYQERYCVRCVHDINENCPVWLIHLAYDDGNYSGIRDALIPRKGLGNDQCKMFVEKSPVRLVEVDGNPDSATMICSCGRYTKGDPNDCKHIAPGRLL